MSCTPVNVRVNVSSPFDTLSPVKESEDRTFVRLVHELEELVDNRLQELPVRLEEARILPNDIHDV